MEITNLRNTEGKTLTLKNGGKAQKRVMQVRNTK